MVHKTGTNLWTDLYTKPTDSHSYLRFESAHPDHCKRSLPYSQFLRVRRICTRLEDFDKYGEILCHHFENRGYPWNLLVDNFLKVRDLSRHSLVHPPPKPPKSDQDDFLIAISTFHPLDTIFQDVIQECWRSLGDPATRSLFEMKVKQGKKRCKNIGDHLVRALCDPPAPLVKPLRLIRDPKTKQMRFHSTICRKWNCEFCAMLDRTGRVRCARTKESFRTRTKISCKSNNLIYALECTVCNWLHYVGETGRTIHARLLGHRTDVKAKDVTKPVGKHFCLPGHNDFSQLKVHILEFCQTPPDKAHKKHREQVERKWQERLRSSYPWGLNWEDAIPFI